MDISGLLKALGLLITGALIPLAPTIYLAVFGERSLFDWYRKRASMPPVPVNQLPQQGVLLSRWAYAVFMLIMLCSDSFSKGVPRLASTLLWSSCIATPVLLGLGLVLAVIGVPAASLALAGGLTALLLLVFVFGGFAMMGLLIALGHDAITEP